MRKIACVLVAGLALAGCEEDIGGFMESIPGTEEFKRAEELRLRRAEEIVQWEQAVASVKCRLVSESQYLPVELQAGITRDRLIEILSQKVANGEAVELPDGGYSYIAGPCGPDPAPVAAAPAPAAT